jgi:hypothetical protein
MCCCAFVVVNGGHASISLAGQSAHPLFSLATTVLPSAASKQLLSTKHETGCFETQQQKGSGVLHMG